MKNYRRKCPNCKEELEDGEYMKHTKECFVDKTDDGFVKMNSENLPFLEDDEE